LAGTFLELQGSLTGADFSGELDGKGGKERAGVSSRLILAAEWPMAQSMQDGAVNHYCRWRAAEIGCGWDCCGQ